MHLLQVSEMIQIDANSTFFLIRNNEEIRGAWNVAQNTVKIYVAKTYTMHACLLKSSQFADQLMLIAIIILSLIHVAKMLWITKFHRL